jgi:PAS domain S-box-containing protein
LKSEHFSNKQSEQSTTPATLESSRSWFWFSARILVLLAMLFGFVIIISRYLSTPALMKAYPDWVSMQFDIVLVFVLIVMGVILALLASLVLNVWQRSKGLQKNLEDEIGRRKEVEKDLARAREMSKIGNWMLELPGRKMQWSDEVCQILDCHPKNRDMTFQNFLKSVHPDDRGFVKREIQRALSHGMAFNLSHRIVRQDGSIKIVKQRSEVFLDSQGRPAKILGALQDITDQKEAENLVARLGRILDRSFNEIYTFDAETLRFTKVNLAARLNLRYSKEELREMTLEDLLPKFAWGQVQRLMSSLRRGIESVTAFEAVHERKNGTTYPVDIRLQLSKAESRPQFVAIVQDITHRKKVEALTSKARQELDKRVNENTLELTNLNKNLRTEIDEQNNFIEALSAREYRLIRIMDNVVDGIITIDEEGTIHSYNRAAEHLFGFKIEEALGQNIDILMARSNGAQSGEYFKHLLQSKKSASLGLRRMISARKKDGTNFSAELAVKETKIGNQRMFTGLIRNLTEKMEIEQELMQILKPMTKS